MSFDARAVANEFLRLAWAEGRDITPMQLVKLTYIAHGWSLALRDRPLIDQAVQAWQYGPVVPEVYRQFRDFGRSPITQLARQVTAWESDQWTPYEIWDPFDDPEVDATKSLIKRVWNSYKAKSAIELSAMTHQHGSPWAVVTKDGTDIGANKRIPDSEIKDHYCQLTRQRGVKA